MIIYQLLWLLINFFYAFSPSQEESVVEESTLSSHGIVTVKQEQSVQDYFSSKMKTLKEKGKEKEKRTKKSKKSQIQSETDTD